MMRMLLSHEKKTMKKGKLRLKIERKQETKKKKEEKKKYKNEARRK